MVFFGNTQNKNNYLAVTTTSPNFNLNSAIALETQQVLSKAVTLAIESQTNAYSVYVRVSNFSYPPGSSLNDFKLAIRLNSLSVTGPYTANYNPVYLSVVDQRIAQAAKNGNIGYWYYDLVLDPLGYNSYPGNYSATLLFTMTQP